MANEIGVMFPASRDTRATIEELRALGFRSAQMAIPGDLDLSAVTIDTLGVYTLFGTYIGESYADVAAVRRTVGFVPSATRAERERRTLDIVDLAARLGVPGVATHVGFIPDDPHDDDFIAVREMVRRVADHAAKNKISFALETGQESADALLDFLIEVNRDNVGVNFDPANMILYGTGDPVEALDVVGQHLITVHAKDGTWPPAATAGALGTEQPIGHGNVNFRALLTMLKKFGYERPIFIEREIEDHDEWLKDLAAAKSYLEAIQFPVV
jgi:sugar phosphate isomerase/epimerase